LIDTEATLSRIYEEAQKVIQDRIIKEDVLKHFMARNSNSQEETAENLSETDSEFILVKISFINVVSIVCRKNCYLNFTCG
jgi:hypothetical protein